MKNGRLFLNWVLLLTGLLLLISCTTTSSVDEEPLVGTWINHEPGNGNKAIFTSDGKALFYLAADEEPAMEARYTIVEKWTDEEDYLYYKVLETWSELPYDVSQSKLWYKLYMIHPSGDVLEGNLSRSDYPEEIRPSNIGYFIDHRQE